MNYLELYLELQEKIVSSANYVREDDKDFNENHNETNEYFNKFCKGTIQ
jgi:hypothetical protein